MILPEINFKPLLDHLNHSRLLESPKERVHAAPSPSASLQDNPFRMLFKNNRSIQDLTRCFSEYFDEDINKIASAYPKSISYPRIYMYMSFATYFFLLYPFNLGSRLISMRFGCGFQDCRYSRWWSLARSKMKIHFQITFKLCSDICQFLVDSFLF